MLNEIDVSLRQAVYYEQLKEQEAEDERERVEEILLVILALILASKIDFSKKVTQAELRSLLASVKAKLGPLVAAHDKAYMAALQGVTNIVAEVTKANYAKLTGKRITAEAFNGTNGANRKLWLQLTRGFVPGVGIEPKNLILDAGKNIAANVARTLKQAYVEKWTPARVVDAFRGTKRLNFKDGLLNKIGNQAKTVTRTLGSHINSFISYNLGRLFYDTYQWISTLDSRTTDVCRSRHMNVYRYGDGPTPPAHHNCRSIIVGMAANLANQYGSNFFSWLRDQPETVLSDMLSPAEARAIRNGTANASDYSAYRPNRRLTPGEFRNRLPFMQAPST